MARTVHIGQPSSAGDHDQVSGGSGQQLTDLVGVGRVVEHDQQATAGGLGTPQLRLVLGVAGDVGAGNADTSQEGAKRLAGGSAT